MTQQKWWLGQYFEEIKKILIAIGGQINQRKNAQVADKWTQFFCLFMIIPYSNYMNILTDLKFPICQTCFLPL